MTRGWGRKTGWMLVVSGLVAGLTPMAADAQQSRQQTREQNRSQDCRCVDDDGNPIDNCTCFRMPDVEAMVRPFMRPRLGISVSTSQAGDLDRQGARVTDVLEDGPAAEAGIREGDVVTSVDGHSLFEPLDPDVERGFDLDASVPVQRLLAIARDLDPGQEVQIEYLRDGETHTATVEARRLPSSAFGYGAGWDPERLREQLRGLNEGLRSFDFRVDSLGDRVRGLRGSMPFVAMGPGTMGRYGLQVVELNEGLGRYFGTTEGVLVTDVDDDSTLGLQAGDVVLSVGSRQVDTPDRLLRILRSYTRDEDITLRVRRDGRELEVRGRLPND